MFDTADCRRYRTRHDGAELMSESHRFIDSAGATIDGRNACVTLTMTAVLRTTAKVERDLTHASFMPSSSGFVTECQ
jgi:hypothetical protein